MLLGAGMGGGWESRLASWLRLEEPLTCVPNPMAAKKKPNALDFTRSYLRKNPKAAFAEIRDAAEKKGLVLYPVSYGRAQALEGIVKMSKYGTSKKAKASGGPKRGPGRPKGSKNKARPAARSGGTGSIDDLVSTIQNLKDERDRALDAIEKIRRLLDTV